MVNAEFENVSARNGKVVSEYLQTSKLLHFRVPVDRAIELFCPLLFL
jgi:hypothetical protein